MPVAAAVCLCFVLTALATFVCDELVYAALSVAAITAFLSLLRIFTYRTKFKFTDRGIIYAIISYFCYFLITAFLLIFIKNTYVMALAVCPVILGSPLIIKLIEMPLNKAYEDKNRKFIYAQKEKLSAINPIVIGITGSYGKTSCKKMLEFFLSDKFSVASTDKNFNTPMGVALSVEKLTGNEQVFIAEFGARKVGDIGELCSLFPPDYGIITGMCGQHLEYFGSLGNIYEEKFKLAKAVASRNGTCVFNINDKNVLKMWKEHRGKKVSAGSFKRADVYASDISLSEKGSEFVLNAGGKGYKCKTALLGRHNIQNIVMCAALAIELGCEIENIVKKIEKLPQIKHRLEYIRANGVHILDDAYNGNVYGVRSALEVLSFFPGRHIVVSQGIVELGTDAERINGGVGRELCTSADVVILCGVNAKYILKGLKSRNFAGRIIKARNFKEVQKRIKENVKYGDTLLLQNDIPDLY